MRESKRCLTSNPTLQGNTSPSCFAVVAKNDIGGAEDSQGVSKHVQNPLKITQGRIVHFW